MIHYVEEDVVVKRRWKGLCALWVVLALVVGATPVTIAAEDVPGTITSEADPGLKPREGQTQEEPSEEESSSEEESETETSETEESETETSLEEVSKGATEKPAGEDENGETLEKSAESEETTERVEEETSEEISTEESTSIEETSVGKSTQEESSEGETLQATNPALLESMALTVKAAAAREAATSGEAWLYVGSGEVGKGSYVGSAGNNDVAAHRKQITVQFDSALNTQDGLKDVKVPDGKKLKGWKLWGFNSSGYVAENSGDLGELEAPGQISANNYLEDFKIDNSSLFLLIIPQWRYAKDILDGDSLVMSMGDNCILSEGTWQVNGDTTQYNVGSGGSTVYAAKDGTFIFSKIK